MEEEAKAQAQEKARIEVEIEDWDDLCNKYSEEAKKPKPKIFQDMDDPKLQEMQDEIDRKIKDTEEIEKLGQKINNSLNQVNDDSYSNWDDSDSEIEKLKLKIEDRRSFWDNKLFEIDLEKLQLKLKAEKTKELESNAMEINDMPERQVNAPQVETDAITPQRIDQKIKLMKKKPKVTKSNFKCAYCPTVRSSIANLQHHILKKHAKEMSKFPCQICDLDGLTGDKLKQHRILYHNMQIK